jgi:hypothetical protein
MSLKLSFRTLRNISLPLCRIYLYISSQTSASEPLKTSECHYGERLHFPVFHEFSFRFVHNGAGFIDRTAVKEHKLYLMGGQFNFSVRISSRRTKKNSSLYKMGDRLCGLVVWVPGYRSWSPGFHSWRYKVFWEVVGLERGSLSLVRIIEELLQVNRGSDL